MLLCPGLQGWQGLVSGDVRVDSEQLQTTKIFIRTDPEVTKLFGLLKDLVTDKVTAEAFTVLTLNCLCKEAPISSLIQDFQQNEENVEEQLDEEEDDDDGVQEMTVSAQEARSTLATLKRYGEQKGADDMIDNICLMEQQLTKWLLSSRTQKTITVSSNRFRNVSGVPQAGMTRGSMQP
ncbi:hypothetical protein PoB_003217100 [Plakobranchus ocellatus]|uniref:Uncharacterized protein n=1 Tax=Plakobranchus ocellatus TaxID=259542 RepID=A0AAV4A310_9GAST|nr:hypothetical protein PoB_003217100 [Plakobranchus ocellatus]